MGRQQRRRAEQRRKRSTPGQTISGSTLTTDKRPSAGRSQTSAGSIAAAIAITCLVLAGIGFAVYHATSSRATPTAQATAAVSSTSPVDGISCGTTEALAYHIHQHLALYEYGKPVAVPSSIGIPGSESAAQCFYSIHVHASTPNVIHVESPLQKTFTLGAFFDIWKATAPTAVPPNDSFLRHLQAASPGTIGVFVNGKRWTRGYRTVLLKPHAVITVELGKPEVAPPSFSDWGNL